MRLRWWVPLVPLRSIARSLRSIDQSLKRLADAAEGITPPRALPDEPEPIDVVRTVDFAAAHQIEDRLRRTLRRDPTAEEIEHELEGWEHPGGLPDRRPH